MKTPQDLSGQFLALIAELRDGAVPAELDAAIAELGLAIQHTNRPGEITLKLRFEPAGKSDGGVLLVADSISVKAPKLPKKSTVVFNRDGLVSRQDTAQMTIEDLPQPVVVERPKIVPIAPAPAATGTT